MTSKEDMEAKQRARTSAQGARRATPVGLEALDRDIEAKNRARLSMNSLAKPVKKPAPTSASTANADAEFKSRARSTASGPAMIPGAVAESNVDMDADVDRKMSPDELAKERARSGKPAYIDDDDDDYQKKTKYAAAKGSADAKQKEDEKARAGAHQQDGGDPTKKDGGKKDPKGFEFYEDIEDGLAVAQAVREDDSEEDGFIPAAVEYDPESKPGLHKNPKVRVWTLIGCLAVAACAVAGIMIPTQMNQVKFDAPTMAPTTYRESLGIQEKIESLVGSEVLEDPESPYSRALDWILNEDPMQLSLYAVNLAQRFIMAYFYFGTTKHGPWRSCNPAMVNETSECALKSFVAVRPLVFEDQPSMVRWLSEEHECKWATVVCNEDNVVTKLDTWTQLLTGPFPSGIKYLPELREIDFMWNALTGTIPSSFGYDMPKLESANLHGNFFTGTIPDSLFQLQNLRLVNFGFSYFTGTLPEKWNTPKLEEIYMMESQISGTIPQGMIETTTLTALRLQLTLLSGTIPTQLARLTNLKEFWAYQMKNLVGTVPSEIGSMPNLQDLRLQGSPNVSGIIPVELFAMPEIHRLEFSGTNVVGHVACDSLGSQLEIITVNCQQVTCLCCAECLINATKAPAPSNVTLLPVFSAEAPPTTKVTLLPAVSSTDAPVLNTATSDGPVATSLPSATDAPVAALKPSVTSTAAPAVTGANASATLTANVTSTVAPTFAAATANATAASKQPLVEMSFPLN